MALDLRKGALVVVALFAIQILATATAYAATPSTATPIKHVVVVMMENHSFDNLFGLYPTLNSTNSGPIAASLQQPDDVFGAPKGIGLSQIPNGTYSTANPNEDVYPADWDNGKMDGFASNSGSVAMTYFSSSQLAVEWDWAEEYAIADRYFAACMCMTDPNRLFSLAGYSGGETIDFDPPPYIPANQSIFAELNTYGVSWGYYVLNPAADNFPLNYFEGIGPYSSGLQSWDSFYGALQQGTLPSVSWVMPVGGGASGYDQHPNANVTFGEEWLLGVVDRVMRSQYWNSTAIFITYDEGGGYYDQVPPPVIDGVQTGFRIPLFVISPYTKENYVSNTIMDHSSTLSFIDYNWNLPALNSYVAASGLPLDMFDFNQTYGDGTLVRAPIVLENSSQYPQALQVPISQLPYQRTGSTSVTLASLGAKLYVSTNSTITPFTQSVEFAAAVAVGLLAVGYLAVRMIRSGRRVTSPTQVS